MHTMMAPDRISSTCPRLHLDQATTCDSYIICGTHLITRDTDYKCYLSGTIRKHLSANLPYRNRACTDKSSHSITSDLNVTIIQ